MGKYSAGWLTLPGIGRRYRDEAGNFYQEAPGGGRQVLGELFGRGDAGKRASAYDIPGFNQDGSMNLRGIPFIGGFENVKREILGNYAHTSTPPLEKRQWKHPKQKGGNSKPSDNAVSSGGNTGRNVEKVSPTGVVQRGTQTSPASTPIEMDKGFDQMLAEMGLTDYYNGQAFTSNQLPTTNSNPFSANSTPKTAAFNPQAPGITGNTYDNYGSEGGAAAASQPLIDGNEKFNPNVERIEGASDAPKRKSLNEALSDTSGMRVDSPELRELRARAAFLDADDSMTGLKRAQATRGVVYAGGQHYIKDGDGKQAIDTADARRINSGKIGADALLQEYKDKITASGAQNPTEVGDSTNPSKSDAGGFVNPGKSQDTEAYNPTKGAPLANSQSNPGNPGPAIDFNNNNKQADPGFNTDMDLLGKSRVKLPMNGGMF